MRRKRYKPEGFTTHYHLMSRTVNGEKWFGGREKERLRKLIWQVAEFSGIRVITYAVMDNHFHVLVEVPASREVDDRELVRRYRVLYPRPTPWNPVGPEALEKLLAEDGVHGQRLRRALQRRMHDISWMAKTIKQRFATWFNQSRQRFGPVWSERFKSVLVEGDLKVLRTVAAYIDLNAVRAGKASDPKDYRFCGYAEAVAGRRVARGGIRTLGLDLPAYRQTLFGVGSAPREGKAALDRKQAEAVIERDGGRITVAEALRCRIRHLTDGLILGSPEFIEQQIERFSRETKRPARPKPVPGWEESGLSTLSRPHGAD